MILHSIITLDHLDSFASIYEHMDVAKNFGVAIAALDNAIARLRSEEHSSEDPYQHSQLVILNTSLVKHMSTFT